MCCFSRSVNLVANTNIFARAGEGNRQYLVYSMAYAADEELAMILPLPTPPNSAEEAVQFIDLSGYPRFFDDLKMGFPVSRGGFQPQGPTRQFLAPAPLKVHEVGSFEASFVPTQNDFARLDPRFRLPSEAWKALPQYKDWGFAVFKLKPGAKTVHPMAMSFPRREPKQLFFPTVHIHDGEAHAKAEFDHALYCQLSKPSWGFNWQKSYNAAEAFMKVEQAAGVVAAGLPVYLQRIQGMQKNVDVVVKL
jgi:hypothetical protein